MRTCAGAWVGLAALAAGWAAGCGRADLVHRRIEAVPDPHAREVLRDCLWAHGSVYRWADQDTVRCEVTRTEHRPLGDVAVEEVWLLEVWTGRLRIERPATREALLCDGHTWRRFVGGRSADDLEARGEAAGLGRAVRELLTMPLGLVLAGGEIQYVGTRPGPAEARTWERLMLTYPGPRRDRAVAEIDGRTHRLDALLAAWPQVPFMGRLLRMELDDWRPVGDLLVSAGGSFP